MREERHRPIDPADRRSAGADRRGGDPVPAAERSRMAVADQMVDLAKLAPNGQEMRAIRGAEIALIFQEPMSSFSPVHTVGNQIIEAIMLHQQVDRRQARAKAIEMLRRVGRVAARAADGPARQSTERGPAPAGHDRHGPLVPSDPADRRRAHDRPRRDHPDADPRADAPSPARGRDGHHAHHARPGRHRRDGHRRGGDVPGPRGRAGAGRRDLPRPAASVYPGAPALHPPHSLEIARAADADRGLRAAPLRPADGLPLPPALRSGHGGAVRAAGAELAPRRRTGTA